MVVLWSHGFLNAQEWQKIESRSAEQICAAPAKGLKKTQKQNLAEQTGVNKSTFCP